MKEPIVVPLPGWLVQYKEQPPVLPWLPSSFPNKCIEKNIVEAPKTGPGDVPHNLNDAQGHQKDIEHHVNDVKCYVDECILDKEEKEKEKDHLDDNEVLQNEDKIIALQTPPCVDEGRKEPSPTGHGVDLHALAQSLREAWLERQPTSDDLEVLHALSDPVAFLDILMPWTMEDDFVLDALDILMTKDSGYLWSSQIMSFFLLPKVLHFEIPASRFLTSAVMQAARVHTRAAIDALFLPLMLIKKGLNEAQCDVMNRVVKECMADHHLLSFCEKVFIKNKRHLLPFTPPFQILCTTRLVWSEPVCSIIQSILSRMVSVDEELLSVIINACSEEVGSLSKSLKFSNLLLCIISRFGPCLKPYRSMIQRVCQRTQTFMTTSLITKSSAL